MGSMEHPRDLLKSRRKDDRSFPPLMNIQAIKSSLVRWLADIKLPSGCEARSWEELIQEFPHSESEAEETTGAKLRLALRLFTVENNYLISLMERLEPDSRGVYLISVHVNWKVQEKQTQQLIEESYQGQFDESLRPRHTLWAQTFRDHELPDALASCFKALLAHELIAGPLEDVDSTPVTLGPPAAAHFPSKGDD